MLVLILAGYRDDVRPVPHAFRHFPVDNAEALLRRQYNPRHVTDAVQLQPP